MQVFSTQKGKNPSRTSSIPLLIFSVGRQSPSSSKIKNIFQNPFYQRPFAVATAPEGQEYNDNNINFLFLFYNFSTKARIVFFFACIFINSQRQYQ